MLTCCLVLPTIKRRFHVLVLILSLGLPWSTVEFFSSGVDLLQSQLPIPSWRPIAWSKCRSYRCHKRFKSPQGTRLHKINKDLGSWVSLPSLLLHILKYAQVGERIGGWNIKIKSKIQRLGMSQWHEVLKLWLRFCLVNVRSSSVYFTNAPSTLFS